MITSAKLPAVDEAAGYSRISSLLLMSAGSTAKANLPSKRRNM